MEKYGKSALMFGRLFCVVIVLLFCGCLPQQEEYVTEDAGQTQVDAESASFTSLTPQRKQGLPDFRVEIPRSRSPRTAWRPQTHPTGTLLVDSAGVLYMVVNPLERMRIRSEDALYEAGLHIEDAIPMSAEEQSCLLVRTDTSWWPESVADWHSCLGPEEGGWIISLELGLKRRASYEVIDSWGFYPWTDEFQGSLEDWNQLREVDRLLPRPGFMIRTERGLSYFEDQKRFLFENETLAEAAGYSLEHVRTVSEERLADYPVFGMLTPASFSFCPAETFENPPDRDGDAIPDFRDCDEGDELIGEGLPEICDGNDNDCNGITDDPFPVGVPCEYTEGTCRLPGTEQCRPDHEGTYCVPIAGRNC